MYKEYLAEFWYSAKALENSKVSFSIPTGGIYDEVGVNTFRNAIGAHYLPHPREYVAPPFIDITNCGGLIIGRLQASNVAMLRGLDNFRMATGSYGDCSMIDYRNSLTWILEALILTQLGTPYVTTNLADYDYFLNQIQTVLQATCYYS
ncbi:hypothetical protein Tco_0761364 [Tanacetum coccineum]